MRLIVVEDEEPEVVVDGNEDPLFADRPAQEGLVAGVRDDFGCLANVVALIPQPVGESASGATVNEKLQPCIAMWSRRSLAITAWA